MYIFLSRIQLYLVYLSLSILFLFSKSPCRYFISNSKDQTIKLWDLRMMLSMRSLHYLCSFLLSFFLMLHSPSSCPLSFLSSTLLPLIYSPSSHLLSFLSSTLLSFLSFLSSTLLSFLSSTLLPLMYSPSSHLLSFHSSTLLPLVYSPSTLLPLVHPPSSRLPSFLLSTLFPFIRSSPLVRSPSSS